jgi:hypothetical protein
LKRWLKAVILTYLSILFFGSFLAVGMLWTGTLEKSLPFISKIRFVNKLNAVSKNLFQADQNQKEQNNKK